MRYCTAGVLNTDNMSILGLTLDYGPFGFLDKYNDNHVCNGSDDQGRYAYAKQPEICDWNCRMLGEALRPVLPRAELTQVRATSEDHLKFKIIFCLDTLIPKMYICSDQSIQKIFYFYFGRVFTTGVPQ